MRVRLAATKTGFVWEIWWMQLFFLVIKWRKDSGKIAINEIL